MLTQLKTVRVFRNVVFTVWIIIFRIDNGNTVCKMNPLQFLKVTVIFDLVIIDLFDNTAIIIWHVYSLRYQLS